MSHEHHQTPGHGSSQATPIPGHHPHARGPAAPDATRRLDVFIIDSGWNAPISTALTKNLSQIRVYLEEDTIYLVDQPRSIALLKSNPHLIGHDPMILFLDRLRKDAGHERFGIRLNLGLLRKPEQALARLQSALRIVAENRACPDMYHAVEKQLWRAGLDGAFKVIGESALEIV